MENARLFQETLEKQKLEESWRLRARFNRAYYRKNIRSSAISD
jgi:hypothetical protein